MQLEEVDVGIKGKYYNFIANYFSEEKDKMHAMI